MTVPTPPDAPFPWEETEDAEEAQTSIFDEADEADEVAAAAAEAESDGVVTEDGDGAERAGADAVGDEDEAAAETAADDEDAALEAAAASVAPRERPIAPKEYYAISEVCELVGLKPHVLRYWETQFQVLNPSKNRSGNRVYQRKEIRLILLVKHLLYEEKYTVEGAKQKIEQIRRGGKLREVTTNALDAETIALLQTELRQLVKILTPTGG